FLFGSFFAMARKRFIDAYRFVAALHAHRIELAPGKACPRALERGLGRHDRGAEIFIGALEPRRDVHGVAHRRVIETLARANIAHQSVPRIKPDALVQAEALPLCRFGVEPVQTLAAAQRGADRLLGMVWIVERRAEYGDDGVADIFVDEAAVLLDDIGHCRKIFVHEFHELGWREHLGYRRKTRDVGEVDGDLAIFAAESRRLVRSDHLFD